MARTIRDVERLFEVMAGRILATCVCSGSTEALGPAGKSKTAAWPILWMTM